MSKWIVTEKGIRVNVDHLIAYGIETLTECCLSRSKQEPKRMSITACVELHTPIQAVTLDSGTYDDMEKRLGQLDYLMRMNMEGLYTLDDLSKLYPGGKY